jgi:DNA-binding SARP family transcriptional activator
VQRSGFGASDGAPQRPSMTKTTSEKYEAQLFGPFQILRNGKPLNDPALGRTSVRILLTWFLLNPGVHFESAELCELLWPSRRPANRSNRLAVTLHYLRHLLEPELGRRQPSKFIRSDGHGRYWFDYAGCWWTDVLDVERLFAAAKTAETKGDASAAITSYERLLDYYSQTFLPENLFDEVFDSVRAAQDVVHHTAQSRLLRLYLRRGLPHKVLSCALSVQDRDPYAEEAATAIAELNLLQGNTLAARTQLAGYVQTVHRELGVDPSPEVMRLWERVRRAG